MSQKEAAKLYLIDMAKNGSYIDRMRAASSPLSPPEVLESLYQDCNEKVKYAVAENPNTPDWVLVEMAREDKSPLTFMSLARNIALPVEAMELIIEFDSYVVNEILVKNPILPLDILRKFVEKLSTRALTIDHPRFLEIF